MFIVNRIPGIWIDPGITGGIYIKPPFLLEGRYMEIFMVIIHRYPISNVMIKSIRKYKKEIALSIFMLFANKYL